MWIGCAQSGRVEQVKAFPSDPDRIVAVRFTVAREAATCVQAMHGRVYNGRMIAATHWDGNSRRALPAELDEERVRRLGGGAGAQPVPPAAPAAPVAPAVGDDASLPVAAGGSALTPLPSADELAGSSVKVLRALLRERGVSSDGCVEKSDLVERLLSS
ncbi:hypothetical protein T492DRAFT_1037314, partial [Pavlovales sp. CCMP2436]